MRNSPVSSRLAGRKPCLRMLSRVAGSADPAAAGSALLIHFSPGGEKCGLEAISLFNKLSLFAVVPGLGTDGRTRSGIASGIE